MQMTFLSVLKGVFLRTEWVLNKTKNILFYIVVFYLNLWRLVCPDVYQITTRKDNASQAVTDLNFRTYHQDITRPPSSYHLIHPGLHNGL